MYFTTWFPKFETNDRFPNSEVKFPVEILIDTIEAITGAFRATQGVSVFVDASTAWIFCPSTL